MTASVRLLVVDCNIRDDRDAYQRTFGQLPGAAYAAAIASVSPGIVYDIALPADSGANLPDPAGLAAYDGIVLTGSSLNIYDGGAAVARQIELMRAIYASKTPVFGSCWGIQLAAVAAGGVVHKNPRGREVGIARRIVRTAAGAGHPLLDGRPATWDAPCSHLDEIAVPPGETTVLAANAVSGIQAAEIRHDGCVFWGVQYHPEFTLADIAFIMRRRLQTLVSEGYGASDADLSAHLDDLETLDRDPARKDLAWQLALDAEVLDPIRRRRELQNFIEQRVKPNRSRRG